MPEPIDSAKNYVEEHVYNDTQKGVSVADQVEAAFLAGFSAASVTVLVDPTDPTKGQEGWME